MKINNWSKFHLSRANSNSEYFSKEEEAFLLENKSDKKAFSLLVITNIPLCKNIALKQGRNNVDFDDLLQEGIYGLIVAIQKYDACKETRLTTYAYHWITKYIKQYIEDHSRTIRVPSHQWEVKSKIEKQSSKVNKYKTLESLTGLTSQQIQNALNAFDSGVFSTNDNEDKEIEYKDNISVEEEAINNIISEEAFLALSEIGSVYVEVFKMFYGFYGRPYTIDDIAKELIISNDEIVMLHNEALEYLRRYFSDEVQ